MLYTQRLMLVTLLLLVVFSCKKEKDSDTDNNGLTDDETYYQPLHMSVQALAQLEAKMMEYSRNGDANSLALVKAAADLVDGENVTAANHFDSTYVYITMASGMEVIYALIPSDAAGNPLTRGGGYGGGTLKRMAADCANDITNRKILQFNAEFQTSPDAAGILAQKEDEFDLEVTTLSNTACTYEVLNTFKDYGLVIINTHGLPNGFMLGTKLPVSLRDSAKSLQDFAQGLNLQSQDKLLTDRILVDLQLNIIHSKNYQPTVPLYQQTSQDADKMDVFVPSKLIAQLDLSSTVVFGNMCYSGYSNTVDFSQSDIPILTAFQQAGVRSYYGYQMAAGKSRQVNDGPAKLMEKRLYEGLFLDDDSLGIAHLKDNTTEYFDTVWASFPDRVTNTYGNLYFRHFFADDYCYKQCPDTIVDNRDGQDYKVTCIGNQIWMAENLNVDEDDFTICPPNLCVYGQPYAQIDLSSSICPDGWHIPTRAEWETLIAEVGGDADAGDALKATTTWGSGQSDPYGFAAESAGSWEEINNQVVQSGEGSYIDFWTSTKIPPADTTGYRVRISKNSDAIDIGVANSGRDFLYCRCVKD